MADACTGLPETWWITSKINECCAQHDRDYVEQIITRSEADKRFEECMKRQDIPDSVAAIIGAIVTVFGGFYWYRRKIKKWLSGGKK